jgi:hypothetical protein
MMKREKRAALLQSLSRATTARNMKIPMRRRQRMG